MKKFKIKVPCDYVDEYLRYGHGEAIIEAENVSEAKQKAYELDDYKMIVDSYEVNDHAEWDFDEIEIEEMK